MSETFTCAVCHRQRERKSHFMWLAVAVSYLFGQPYGAAHGPVCVECAPSLATVGGRVLIGLVVLGFILAFLYGPFNFSGRP
jgi:hypothetical protein